ncbi:MAG: hypothetical protein ACRC41_16280 [Sarcina sp.]
MKFYKNLWSKFWDNKICGNKTFRLVFFAIAIFGIIDGVINSGIEYGGFPVALLFGIFSLPFIGIIGIIYEKVKFGTSLLTSFISWIFGVGTLPITYFIFCMPVLISLKILGGLF